jgi:hypothetical protein
MKTPVTDAAAEPASYFLDSLDEVVSADVARRLELDRAALIEALEGCLRSMTGEPKCTYWCSKSNAATALTAARANFPES